MADSAPAADRDSRVEGVSPLAGRAPGGVLDLREIPARGKIILRGDAADAAFLEAAGEALGVAPPRAPNTTAAAADVRVLWLGPDEWMVWCEWRRRLRLRDDLEKALAASHRSVVDVSDYYALVAARGAHIRAALAHGCPLDLDRFAVDSCAQTRFRRAAVTLFRAADSDGEPVFEIQTRWSFADYVWRVLARAGELAAAAAARSSDGFD